MFGDKGFRPKPAPVNVGDELDVVIEAQGKKGDGIAKKDGFVLFVANVRKGDNVKVRVSKVLKNVGFAEVVGGPKKREQSDDDSDQAEEQVDEETSDSESEDEDIQDTEDFGEEER